jgi:enterochelin esterase-like enzyme
LDDTALSGFPPILITVKQTFGAANSPTRAANNLFKLVRELPAARIAALPFLYLDCGTEDLFRLLPVNRMMGDLLTERKIPHEYRERPGGHNMAYWGHQAPELLRVAAENLKLPAATTAASH